jgi:hypothetical protein
MKTVFLAPPFVAVPYCWLFEIGLNKLGVHQRDGWCMKLGERIVLLDSEDKCVPLEPILDVDEKLFFNFLQEASLELPAYADSIALFPKVPLLKHVFHTSFSGYWPERAIAWLDADPSIQGLFQDELEKLILNKVMPQGLRQRAKRILQRLRNAGSSA